MPAPTLHRKNSLMRNSHVQEKFLRGSTSLQEMQQGLENTPYDRMPTDQPGLFMGSVVERLWPFDQVPDCPTAPQPADL